MFGKSEIKIVKSQNMNKNRVKNCEKMKIHQNKRNSMPTHIQTQYNHI